MKLLNDLVVAVANAVLVMLAIICIVGGFASRDSGYSIAGAILVAAFIVAHKDFRR